jgi:hypothetical protein
MLNNKILQNNGYTHELSSFEYMPKYFLGICTTDLAKTWVDKKTKHPYLCLKDEAMKPENTFENRIQAVRYMCRIPFKNYVQHCIDVSEKIIIDDQYDIYQRFYFFSNNNKYTKLDDHIVHHLHNFFFYYAKEFKHPLELILMSCRYIMQTYDYVNPDRINVYQFLLNIAQDINETIFARSQSIDIILHTGDFDEVDSAKQLLNEITTDDKNIYLNSQNVHNETINISIRNILRALLKNKPDIPLQIEHLQNRLETHCNSNEDKEKMIQFLYRIMTDPSKYETLNLCEILTLVLNKIDSFETSIQSQCYKRLFEEAVESSDTCSSGYLSRILNVLTGFVQEEELVLRISPTDELRSSIFARLNTIIRGLKDIEKELLFDDLYNQKYETFDEFMGYYSPEDELREEYKGILNEDEFTNIFNKTIDEFKGIN